MYYWRSRKWKGESVIPKSHFLNFIIDSYPTPPVIPKSALIQMLAGELPPSSGVIQRKHGSTIAYSPQDPWIMGEEL